tara:strand:+ start:5430 stop:5648 length:219 start_codon:yes stop_codon:yes gene_type:complete
MDITNFTTKEQMLNYVNEDGQDRHLYVQKQFGEEFTIISDNDEQIEYLFAKTESGYEFSHEEEFDEWCIEEE